MSSSSSSSSVCVCVCVCVCACVRACERACVCAISHGHSNLHSCFCPPRASVFVGLRIWGTVLLLYGAPFVSNLIFFERPAHRSEKPRRTIVS